MFGTRFALHLALLLLAIPLAAGAEPSPGSSDFAGTVEVDGRKLYVVRQVVGAVRDPASRRPDAE
jgi:hypothetical protein